MAEDDMDEGTARRQADADVEALREEAIRTVGRQVDYGKSMFASGKEAGAREERERIRQELAEAIGQEEGPDVPKPVLAVLLMRIVHRKEPDHG